MTNANDSQLLDELRKIHRTLSVLCWIAVTGLLLFFIVSLLSMT